MRLKGKKVVITAAAQGIGMAAAELFSAEGAEVFATDINLAKLSDVKAAHTMKLDVLSSHDIAKFAQDIGAIDVLFNCAGFVHSGGILECNEQDWDFSFDLNVKSVYRTCRAFLPAMIEQKSGSIINMSSVASSIKGVGNRVAYGATKAAVIGLTKALADEVVAHGVRVNAICPGTIETPSLQERMSVGGNYEQNRANFVARQRMGRLGKPIEIAQLALYLASDESTFTTGQSHIIDGGWAI